MIELTLYNIQKHFGFDLVLNNIAFKVYDKEKVGIVGENGCGKSTILKLIAGIEPMDRDDREEKGYITMPKGTSVGYLDQIPNYPNHFKVNDILNLAFKDIYSIEKQLRDLENSMAHLKGIDLDKALKQYSHLQESYDAEGGYTIHEKLSKVCKGLKLHDDFLNKDFNILSGGEKTTVLLGKLLLESPDILLLDEPTNHLDMDSTEWLEDYIRNYNGMVLIVSHDRYFLDSVVTRIIEIENKKCEAYKGNYSEYIKQKDEKMLLQFEDFKEQQKKITSMENKVKTLRDWALRANNKKFFKRAFSIQKKLDKMEKIDKPIFEKKNIKLNFIDTERSGFNIITADKISKAFNNKVLLNDANLNITIGERVALIGPNGCGKTTFLKMLLGETNVDNGTLKFGANIKLAYLPQNIIFNNDELTVLECFRENNYILQGEAREYLSKFMFFGKDVFKKIKHLSGGEKVRLKLALLLFDEINLLILDEPTNHLDIDSMEVLEEALEDFKGTVFFISHDRYFINKVCNRIVAMEDNKFVNYLGNYDFYKDMKNQLLLAQIQPPTPKKKKNTKEQPMVENKKRDGEISKLESNIKILEDEVKETEEIMVSLGNNYEELIKLQDKKDKLNKDLEEMLETWLNLTNSYN